MPYHEFVWTKKAIRHLAEHGVSQADFEYLLGRSKNRGFSRSSGLPAVWGYTRGGRYLMAVYEELDLPVTAYDVPEPRRRK